MTSAFRVLSRSATLALVLLSACLSEMPRTLPTEAPPPRTLFVPSFMPTVAQNNGDLRASAKPNKTKYRDTGAKPTSGKAKTAALEMRAMVDKGGSTLVEVTAGSFDAPATESTLEKVQLRAVTASQDPINERPGMSAWQHVMPGLIAGDQLRLQANLRGAGASRMEVIDVTTTVVRRPDISVQAMSGAAQAHTGSAVTFYADVAELNGNVGARANCRLFIDGTPVDEATGIWVDAGDLVTCQFSYVFESTGTYTMSVSALNVEPGDWDLANNSNSMTVTVVSPGTPIAFGQLTVEDASYVYSNSSQRSGTYPLNATSGGSEQWSRVSFQGNAVTPLPGPMVRVDAKVSSGATTIYQTSLTQLTTYSYVSGGANVTCIDFNTNGETASSCTSQYFDGSGFTTFAYSHQSGSVTFYGQTLYCNTFGCNTFTQNGERLSGWGQRYGFSAGSNVRVQVTFVDGQGTNHVSDRSASLMDISGPVNFDRSSCAPYWDGLGDVCTRQTSTGTRWRGITTW